MTSENYEEGNLESILSKDQNDEQNFMTTDPNLLNDIEEVIDSLNDIGEVIDSLNDVGEVIDSLKEVIEESIDSHFEVGNDFKEKALQKQKGKNAFVKASYDDDNYLILTESQSEERIILLLIISSLLSSLIVLTYLTHFALTLATDRPKVVQPNLKQYMQGII